jgi:hypothetical protein
MARASFLKARSRANVLLLGGCLSARLAGPDTGLFHCFTVLPFYYWFTVSHGGLQFIFGFLQEFGSSMDQIIRAVSVRALS